MYGQQWLAIRIFKINQDVQEIFGLILFTTFLKCSGPFTDPLFYDGIMQPVEHTHYILGNQFMALQIEAYKGGEVV